MHSSRDICKGVNLKFGFHSLIERDHARQTIVVSHLHLRTGYRLFTALDAIMLQSTESQNFPKPQPQECL